MSQTHWRVATTAEQTATHLASHSLFLNSEFLAEEIVRTLVGSLGLIAAVPISTLVATALIVYQDRLGEWRGLLSPQSGDAPGHSHT